jgi:hypothetical protein
MHNFSLKKRTPNVLFFFLLFFSFSCVKPCQQWEMDHIEAQCPYYNSTKIYLPALNSFSNLEVEIVRTANETRMYFNIFTLEFPWICEDESKTEVCLVIDQQEYRFLADRLEGGQRLLLPPDALELVVQTLLQYAPVQAIVGRYTADIIPNNFCVVYNRLLLKTQLAPLHRASTLPNLVSKTIKSEGKVETLPRF